MNGIFVRSRLVMICVHHLMESLKCCPDWLTYLTLSFWSETFEYPLGWHAVDTYGRCNVFKCCETRIFFCMGLRMITDLISILSILHREPLKSCLLLLLHFCCISKHSYYSVWLLLCDELQQILLWWPSLATKLLFPLFHSRHYMFLPVPAIFRWILSFS
jgi:hypothetical protein